MKKTMTNLLSTLALAFIVSALGCNTASDNASPDMAAIKEQIQAKETAFAAAQTAGDVDALAAFYADDAVTMNDGQAASAGKEAIKKELLAGLDQRGKGSVTTYNVEEVYGSENQVTEIGKTTVKDTTGKVIYNGKYMAIWEKRNGEYTCVRDISNSDAPQPSAAVKSIHVFDMPKDLTEAEFSATIKEMNAVIAGIGYPNAGYAFYKTSDNSVKNNRYYFEGVWPAGDGYKKIHEDPAFIAVAKKLDPLYAKIKAVEMYRRVVKVE